MAVEDGPILHSACVLAGLHVRVHLLVPAACTSIYKLTKLNTSSDVLPLNHLPQFLTGSAGGQYEEKLRESKYCLAVYGYGYGMRLSHAMMTNCVPVIIQVSEDSEVLS